MDGQQFDKFARVVASGTSRRRVLGLFASGVAAVTSSLSLRQASAGGCEFEGNECNDDNLVCCSGLICVQGICEAECGTEGDSCVMPSDVDQSGGFFCCNQGLECIDGTCEAPEPICSDEGGSCSGGKGPDCCNKGLECVDGICEIPEPVCIETGDSCVPAIQGSITCCDKGAECIDGICQIPEPACIETGETCFDGEECCDPDAQCIAETCMIPEPECIEEGGSCAADEECCAGICCGGICVDIECCIDDENPNDRCDEGTSCFEGICEGVSEICEDDADCGSDTCCCDDGSCSDDCCEDEEEVTELPNTGSGDGSTSRAGWFGAAAIGAAAAFLGSKKLQPQEQPAEIDKN